MADLFREVDEALREDRARIFWRKYGTLLIAMAIALVLGTAAYVGWESWQHQRRQARSAELASALALAQNSPESAADALAAIAAEDGSATVARFYEAGLRAEAGDTAAAASLYRGLAGDGNVDQVWRDLARILAVLHEMETGDPAALEAELAPLAADASAWRFSARELIGLLALRQDDRERALAQFAALADDPEAPVGVRSRAAELETQLGGGGGQ